MGGADVDVHEPTVSHLDAPLGHGAVPAGLKAHLSALCGDALEVTWTDEQLDALTAQDDQAVGDPFAKERPHGSTGLLGDRLGDGLFGHVDQLAADPPVGVSEILEEMLDPLKIDAGRPILQTCERLFESGDPLELLEALVHTRDAAVEQVEKRDACAGGGSSDEIGPGADG